MQEKQKCKMLDYVILTNNLGFVETYSKEAMIELNKTHGKLARLAGRVT